MGFIAAGIAVAAVGAGASAYGSAQQAGASEDAAKYAAYLEKKFGDEQLEKLDKLTAEKEEKLENITSTLDRFGGGAIAGSQENLDLLRKAQNDFLKLGAGDFSAFEDQLKDVMASTLANTYGSGAPAGAFTQLSAQNVAALRQQGIASGSQVGQLLASDTYNLLGTEFSLADQEFQQAYDIEGRQIGAISGYIQQAAESAGANWQAAGGFLQTVGSSLATFGMGQATGAIPGGAGGDVASGFGASARPSFAMPGGGASYAGPSVAAYTPSYIPSSSFTPSYPTNFSAPSVPTFNGGSYGGSMVLPPKDGYGGNTSALGSYLGAASSIGSAFSKASGGNFLGAAVDVFSGLALR